MIAPRLVWMPPDFDVAYVSKSDYDELQAKLKSTERELAKWKEPFDQEKFDAAAKQASHKDSLAAMCVYQTALEHALKHHQAKLTETEAEVSVLKAEITAWQNQGTAYLSAINEKDRLLKVALGAMKNASKYPEYDSRHDEYRHCCCNAKSNKPHLETCYINNAIKEIEGAMK